jgi:hypothetical protein
LAIVDFEIIDEIGDIETVAVNTSMRDLDRLKKMYGIGPGRRLKGSARVRLRSGRIRLAELHWYEAHGIGIDEPQRRFVFELAKSGARGGRNIVTKKSLQLISYFRSPLLGCGGALVWFAALVCAAWTNIGAAAAQTGLPGAAATAVSGAIDIHVHSTPDDRPRSIDAMDVARLARARGLRGIVLKNHYESTAGLAFIVRKEVPGIEVFGGIDLNLTVGGINPAAVEHMTRVSGGWGRVVWMPTFDAENQVRYSKEDRSFVSVSRNGRLLPEVEQVIALIAKHGLALATGHSAPAEVLMMLREARRQGVSRMVVTHAMNAPVLMNISQMQEAAKEGAFIEFVGGSLAGAEAAARIDRFADAIRKIGPAFCILSSDLGQVGNPLPPDGFAEFLVALRARGFSEQEIERMSKQNPAQLLGLQ